MNNLRKFNTEAEYSAATLNYPAVSWVTATDNVHFDKCGTTPTVNDKIIMAQSYNDGGGDSFSFMNCGTLSFQNVITSVTLNDVDKLDYLIQNHTCSVYIEDFGLYTARIGLSGTTIDDWFSGDLGFGEASSVSGLEVLIPSQITEIDTVPENCEILVLEETTPPTLIFGASDLMAQAIYVPDSSVSIYESTWVDLASRIYPMSDYQGNLPV